ncbi:OLC1v1029450C1 [Oldenlandia corymbosa var. corymbosa]|uniref:OLC1v1029450C1 n=1 Tax=Oldenlandia corymbosa var. corymbosa TaxID=529605 RepID=A0AAV1CEE1_OLDCO|nr:OLC1v1029450C1 [Oldenlandia corymbosa var. corymbosa]
MASFTRVIASIAIFTALASTSTLAKDIVVGDENGWKLNFDYQDWAKGKQFFVGDRLIFNYAQGAHNVYKVDGNGFKTCTYDAGTNALTSGKDVITIAGDAGKRWYICGVGNHCEQGMKLVINVQTKDGYSSDKEGSSSDKSAATPSSGLLNPQFFACMIASLAVFLVTIMV